MSYIQGPFKFSNDPPKHLMGWDEQTAAAENKKAAMPFHSHPLEHVPIQPGRRPIWSIVKQYNFQHHLPTFEQQVGDCVGAGAKQMGDYLTYVQIGRSMKSQYFRPWHASWIYGMSRVHYDLQSIGSDGSTGRAAALVIKNAGVYFTDWQGAEPYSGALSRKWGDEPGPPDLTRALARPHTAVMVEQITTVEQLRAALLSDKMVTIASMRGFDMRPINKQGFHVFKPSGSWAHQMCIIDWMDEPFPAAYRLNSWGPDAHGTPLNDEPPGGAWNLADDLRPELQNSSTECFAFSLFHAWPTEPNWRIIPDPDDPSPPLPYTG